MGTAGLGNGNERPQLWSLRLFGGFELSAQPKGERVTSLGKRERVLLAYLALSPNHRQQRRKLAGLLWGDATDETLLDNLRTCIWSLRKGLGDTGHQLVASDGEDIVLNASAFDVDALTFRRLATQSGRADLKEAANLYVGAFLDGLDIDSEEYEAWRREEATRYRDQTIDVLVRLLTELSEFGETEHAIQVGQRILTLEPLHEPAARRLMRLYAESGRRGAAIKVYRALADRLRTELDAQPEAETRAAFAEVARGKEDRIEDTAAADPKPSLPSPRNPTQAVAAYRASSPLSPPPSRSSGSSSRANPWLVVGSLAAAAMALILLVPFSRTNDLPAPQTDPGTARASSIAIAVLPFVNLSGDTTQEFFSDGITDEITSTLAKIPDLRVVGRTSAFRFKDQKQDLRTIGQSLGATHLIEGSVRKAGDRVRITTQLVEAATGVQAWTNTYDRQLTDVFAIQEDIATAIAAALRVPLGLQLSDPLRSGRMPDAALFDDYLRAKTLMRSRGFERLAEASMLLEPVVAREPDFAPAWALLAQVNVLLPPADPQIRAAPTDMARQMMQAYFEKAERAAREAIRVDPRNGFAYAALARVQERRGRWSEAEDLHTQALSLDPGEPDAQNNYIFFLAATGRIKDALSNNERLRELEPFVPIYVNRMAALLQQSGQTAASITLLESLPPDAGGGGQNRNIYLAQAYTEQGRYSDAVDTLSNLTGIPQRILDDASRLLRSMPGSTGSTEPLPALVPGFGFVYAHVGAFDRITDLYEFGLGRGFNPGTLDAWLPTLSPWRKSEVFKAYVQRAGLVDYWRERGWPDLCRPVGADDFVCD